MKTTIRHQLANRKRRILRRLDRQNLPDCERPIIQPRNIQFQIADRQRGIVYGGIGAMLMLARRLKLPQAIDARLHLLKIHLPYHESDHVLNFALNTLCDGLCLQDMERLRNDDVFLDAVGAARLPDPTTAGDFCRRFTDADLKTFWDIIDDTRQAAWAEQPEDFFTQALLDMDGTLVETTGQCKHGMDIAYNGTWGYHPLLVSLANTREVLRLCNRSGNRPSHEGAADAIDQSLRVCFDGGFRTALLRGDTDFSQTQHLDRWNADARVTFLFGFNAHQNLKNSADELPESAWQPLERPPRYRVKTEPRAKPDNVQDRIVRERGYEVLRLQAEAVAEFRYRPTACDQTYRMIVTRKNISHSKGDQVLFDDIVYFFYITNDRQRTAHELVFLANDRCHQENLIEQLKNGVHALRAPVDTLTSNAAYMAMTSLAWNLKAWFALQLPVSPGRWHAQHHAEKQWLLAIDFRTFCHAFIRLPCQILRTARRLVYRLLSWNPYQTILFRWLHALRC